MAGMGVLIAGNLILAEADNYWMLAAGSPCGAHMALTQGIFSRMIADSAPDHLRATSFGAFWFVNGIAALLASLPQAGRDRDGSSATSLKRRRGGQAAAMLSLLQEERRAA